MKNTTILSLLLLSTFLLPAHTHAQLNTIRQKIGPITSTAQGHVGVALKLLETGDTLSFGANDRYPMQSVFKVPLAIAILDQVDKGRLSLSQKITIRKEELRPTWSPIRKKYPEGTVMSLSDVLAYTVSQSDNNGCDILFRLLGGTAYVNKYIHSLGIDSINIVATEEDMSKAWEVQYTDWSTPLAIVQLMEGIHKGSWLAKSSNDFLLKIMTETNTGPGRIKGLLPANAVVAHKTGTSDTNAQGITAATNDAGIITLPGGQHLAIVVFVSDARAAEKTRDEVIAKIARLCWDALQ